MALGEGLLAMLPQRYLIAVDFAPRFSACAVMDEHATLLYYDAVDIGPESDGFATHCERLEAWLAGLLLKFPGPTHVVVEDASHFMAKPAQVLRLQGAFRRIVMNLLRYDAVMVFPQVWQNFFGWRRSEGWNTKSFAKFVVAVLGYQIVGTQGKATVDVRDAVVIARWAVASLYDQEV